MTERVDLQSSFRQIFRRGGTLVGQLRRSRPCTHAKERNVSSLHEDRSYERERGGEPGTVSSFSRHGRDSMDEFQGLHMDLRLRLGKAFFLSRPSGN